MPGEAELAASVKGLSLKEFFDKHLKVDYWLGYSTGGDHVFILSPATDRSEAGGMSPFNPLGRCTFYTDEGTCSIHDNKPTECALYLHSVTNTESKEYRKEIVEAWRDPAHQAQIAELLGRVPEVPDVQTGELNPLLSMLLERNPSALMEGIVEIMAKIAESSAKFDKNE